MSSCKEQITEFISNLLNDVYLNPIAKHIHENVDSLKEKSMEEIATELREVLNLPAVASIPVIQAIPKTSQGISGLAPSIVSSLPGLGPMAVSAPASAVKRKTTKKEHPPQVWLTLEEYQSSIADGAKICAYMSSRCKDETKKNRVCGAVVEETTETDPNNWRCSQCVGKPTEITKHTKKSVSGIDPIKNLATPIPEVPLASSLPTQPVATIGEIPTPSVSELPPLPVNIPVPTAKPMTPAPCLKLARHNGLKSNHLKASNEDLTNILFSVNREVNPPLIKAVGKVQMDDPISEDYENKVEELTIEEKKRVSRYGISYEFTPRVSLPMSPPKMPSLPSLPSIPGLPPLAGIPGF